MNASFGLIEVTGVVAAIDCLDAMCKASSVTLATWERKLGGRLVTVIVKGSVSDVEEAVEAARAVCAANNHNMVVCGVIASPSEEIVKLINLSASRIKKLTEDPRKKLL